MENIINHTKGLDKKEKDLEIHTRPNASPGFWLCTLLPLCYLINTYKYSKESSTFEHKLTTIISVGFSLQSICLFLFLTSKSTNLYILLHIFVSSAITSACIYYFLKQTLFFSIFFTYIILLSYQYSYIKIFKYLPKSFTLGEASIILQGLFIFIINAILQIPNFLHQHYPQPRIMEMQAIMMTALFGLIIVGLLLYVIEPLRKPVSFYLLMISYIAFVCLIPVTKDLPIVTLWKFITGDSSRILIIIFYFALIGTTAGAIIWRFKKAEKATTSIRKIFHIILVFVFIPGFLHECTLLYIATGVALAFLIIFEMLRLLKIPPFYDYFAKMFELFADEKDAGYVALTPLYLHIGCSLPLWINPSPCTVMKNTIPSISGILSIGIGDTAASVIGFHYGQSKWPGSNKSVEGTLANVICQSAAVILLFAFGYVEITASVLILIPLAITVTSLIEAFTDQIDNIVLPMIFYIISSLS